MIKQKEATNILSLIFCHFISSRR